MNDVNLTTIIISGKHIDNYELYTEQKKSYCYNYYYYYYRHTYVAI